MLDTNEFRARLATSILIAAVSSGYVVTGCSSTTQGGGGGSSSSSTGQGGIPSSSGDFVGPECFTWPQAANGGAGGIGGAGGSGSTASSGGAGGMAGTGGTGGTGGGMGGAGGAIPVTCPPKTDAMMYMTTLQCGGGILTDGTYADGKCCYDVQHYSCITGRPYMEQGRPRMAKARGSRSEWMQETAPSRDGLSADVRARLAAAYLEDALLEHASIASFGRFALELLAVGAPSDLVELAHSAAMDEVRHARLTFGLASAYAGKSVGPEVFPFGGTVPVSARLDDIAARTVQEGCIGETLASLIAAEQSSRAEDPAVRRILAAIAEDEARHAELAWKTVAWAVSIGGESVRRAVAEAFERAFVNAERIEISAAGDESLEKHGRPGISVLRDVIRRGFADVVKPAVKRLLGSDC